MRKMPMTGDTTAPAHICLTCGGSGYTVEPVCCELGANGCDTMGCTGPEVDRVKCEACNSEGVVE